MNEELKKYVQAYIDGEEVEFLGTDWVSVTGLRYFVDEDGDEEPVSRFRIKPKGKVKMWQWVVKDSNTPPKPQITQGFFTEEQILSYYEGFTNKIIKKAEWTEIEVEE